MIYALLGVLIGVLLPNQSAINNRLLASVASPWVMSTISFLVGALCLAVLTLATEGTVWFESVLLTTEPAWLWLGGLFGVVAMTTTVLLLPIIGALRSTALNLTAQVLTTMVIDHFGFFGVTVHPADPWRMIGAGVVVASALLAVRAGHTNQQLHQPSPGWYAVGLAVGVLFGLQVAVNGRLAGVLDSAVHAALISFVVGLVVLAVLLGLTRQSFRIRVPAGAKQNPWWMWLGGVLGALYVAGVAFLAPIIGSALTVVTIQLGLLAGSMAVDHFGLLSAPTKSVRPLQVIGLIFMGCGVVVMNAPRLFV